VTLEFRHETHLVASTPADGVTELLAMRNERVILPVTMSAADEANEIARAMVRANLANGRVVPSFFNEELNMATRSKSSGAKTRRKTTSATKRSGSRGKSTTKTSARRSASSKAAAKKSTRRPAAAKKKKTKRSARKLSPVTRIKRVASTVLQQGASAAKQGVQAVERLVEEVKDRVAT
jgi:hypothetical protein